MYLPSLYFWPVPSFARYSTQCFGAQSDPRNVALLHRRNKWQMFVVACFDLLSLLHYRPIPPAINCDISLLHPFHLLLIVLHLQCSLSH